MANELTYFIPDQLRVLHHFLACSIHRPRCNSPRSRANGNARGMMRDDINERVVKFHLAASSCNDDDDDARLILPCSLIKPGDTIDQNMGVVVPKPFVSSADDLFRNLSPTANSFGNKYRLSYNGEICTATDDTIFVLPRSAEGSGPVPGGRGRGRGKERLYLEAVKCSGYLSLR